MCTLSFDLGNFNRLSAWFFLDTDSGEQQRGSVLTTTAALTKVLQQTCPDKVLCEACTMTYLLADTVEAVLPEADFVATNTNAEAWRWSTTRRKTDELDAERLSRLDRLGELQGVALPTPEMRAMRRLLTCRHRWVCKRTACYNAIRSVCKMHEVALPAGEKAWSQASLADLRKLTQSTRDATVIPIDWHQAWRFELAQLLDQLELLERQIRMLTNSIAASQKGEVRAENLQTIPGVGVMVSAALLAFLGSAQRFKNGQKVAAYAGLVPRVFQSGAQCRHGRITKCGNRLLRKLLINAAWQAVRKDPWARTTFDRLCGGSRNVSRRKRAIVAIARRLLIRCWAMLRDGSTWQPDHQPVRSTAP